MIAKRLAAIETVIQLGQNDKALELLKRLPKRRNVSPLERVTISNLYNWIGRPIEAMRVLGDLLTIPDLKVVSDEELALQSRLAQMLDFSGAQYLAGRLYRHIEDALPFRSQSSQAQRPQLYTALADFYMNQGNYEKALEFHRTSMDLYPSHHYLRWFARVGVADALDGLGNVKEAISEINRLISETPLKQRAYLGIAYQARGEYRFKMEDFELAAADFTEAWRQFPPDYKTKDLAYLAKWSGALALVKQDLNSAQKHLELAYQILSQPGAQPTALLQVLYWMERHSNIAPSLETGLKVALRCYPCFSPYSLLVGSGRLTKAPLHPWIQKRLKPAQGDCWRIDDSGIRPCFYDHWASDDLSQNCTTSVLDLCSGLFYFQGVDRPPLVLSELQSLLLIAVVGSGSLGLNDWMLADFIYRKDFVDFRHALGRIKIILRQLRAYGIEVTRSDNLYHFNSPGAQIILPNNLRYAGTYRRLGAKMREFTRRDVEKYYGATARTANRWILEWLSIGIIEKCLRNGRTYYCFTNPTASNSEPFGP